MTESRSAEKHENSVLSAIRLKKSAALWMSFRLLILIRYCPVALR